MARDDDPFSWAKGKTGRHLYHLVGGSIPPLLGLILTRGWLLVFLGVVTAIFVTAELLRFLFPPINRWLISFFPQFSKAFKAEEAVKPIGTTFFLVGAFLTFLIFPRDVAVTALFFAAVGDAVAAMVGERFGRTKVGNKSIEGTLAFFVSALVVGTILLLAELRLNWIAVVGGALIAALVELVPIPINDNLTVPLISATVMVLVLAS